MGVARAVAMSGVASLLDWSEERWREQLRPGQPHGTPRRNQSQKNERSFVVYARRELELLRDGCGWEAQFPRDVWRVRLLGFQKGSVASLRFDRIPQPWLRELAKRWIRWRLASGRSASQAAVNLQAVTRFAGFLALPAVAVDRLGGIDRSVLERYLADLAHPTPGLKHRAALIGSLNLFF